MNMRVLNALRSQCRCKDRASGSEASSRGRSRDVECDFRGCRRCEERSALTRLIANGNCGRRHADEQKRSNKLRSANRARLQLGRRVVQVHVAADALPGHAVHRAEPRGAAVGSDGGKAGGVGRHTGQRQSDDCDKGEKSSRHAKQHSAVRAADSNGFGRRAGPRRPVVCWRNRTAPNSLCRRRRRATLYKP